MTVEPKFENCKILGLVRSTSVKSANFLKDVASNVRNLAGGQLQHYAQLIDESTEEALQKLKDRAGEMGADAVCGLRLSSSSVTAGGAEIIAYGTAIKFND
jgi:uncharacterized protein YbjQ (UPF0145 family)